MSPIADERPLAFLPVLEDMAQPADLEVVRSSYDRVADNYVAMGVGELAPTPWLRAALAAFAEDVNGLGPVLDVGCGPGTVTAHLAGLGVEVCGVDLPPRMIAHARVLASRRETSPSARRRRSTGAGHRSLATASHRSRRAAQPPRRHLLRARTTPRGMSRRSRQPRSRPALNTSPAKTSGDVVGRSSVGPVGHRSSHGRTRSGRGSTIGT